MRKASALKPVNAQLQEQILSSMSDLHVFFLEKLTNLQAPRSLLNFTGVRHGTLPHWHHCFADKILKTQCPNHLYAGDHDETQPISVMELPVPDSTQIFSSPELSSDVKRAMYKGPGRKKREETPTEEVPKPEHVPLSGDKPALTSPADKKGDFTDDDGEAGWGLVGLVCFTLSKDFAFVLKSWWYASTWEAAYIRRKDQIELKPVKGRGRGRGRGGTGRGRGMSAEGGKGRGRGGKKKQMLRMKCRKMRLRTKLQQMARHLQRRQNMRT